jgi:threonine synthase
MKNDAILICTGCGKEFPLSRIYPRCAGCNEPLEVAYGRLAQVEIPARGTMLERYRDFLPFSALRPELSLGEGNTPLLRAGALAEALGMRSLFFKNETQNPTWSFKDRGTVTGLMHAVSLGITKIGTVSTGNMAVSVAAYGARARLETYVLVSRGIAEEKIAPIAIHGPRLLTVDGDYGELYFRSLEVGERWGIYFINSDVPFRVEGSKTIAFEIYEQLGFQAPAYVVVPTSSGGNFRGIQKGFEELHRVGAVDRLPGMIAAQAAGCAPIAAAFRRGSLTVERVREPRTIAHAIENPFPPSGNQVLRKLRAHGGFAVTVTDEEIIAAQGLMAGTGIFGQPEGAVPLAAVQKLRAENVLKPADSVVCIVSGAGLKDAAALRLHRFEVRAVSMARLEEAFGG